MNTHDLKERYAHVLAWGALCGLRSMSGPALASHRAQRRFARGPLQRRLSKPAVARTVRALAVAELIADKLPFIPSRVELPSLLFRAASGAVTALTADAPRRSRLRVFGGRAALRDELVPALAGAAAAVASAGVAYSVRRALTRRFHWSPLVGGLVEDAVLLLAASKLRS